MRFSAESRCGMRRAAPRREQLARDENNVARVITMRSMILSRWIAEPGNPSLSATEWILLAVTALESWLSERTGTVTGELLQ